ncbi:hypothetical protein, partial [Cloacibacterium sp.]|uniref:hypothetical protein n=1 Tax=Cloacibacterium sp. TaxID=1913682 RepID=UPI0035B173AA
MVSGTKTEKEVYHSSIFKNLSLQSKITPKFHKFAIHSIYEVMSKQTIKEILGGYKKLLHHDITVQGWVRA